MFTVEIPKEKRFIEDKSLDPSFSVYSSDLDSNLEMLDYDHAKQVRQREKLKIQSEEMGSVKAILHEESYQKFKDEQDEAFKEARKPSLTDQLMERYDEEMRIDFEIPRIRKGNASLPSMESIAEIGVEKKEPKLSEIEQHVFQSQLEYLRNEIKRYQDKVLGLQMSVDRTKKEIEINEEMQDREYKKKKKLSHDIGKVQSNVSIKTDEKNADMQLFSLQSELKSKRDNLLSHLNQISKNEDSYRKDKLRLEHEKIRFDKTLSFHEKWNDDNEEIESHLESNVVEFRGKVDRLRVENDRLKRYLKFLELRENEMNNSLAEVVEILKGRSPQSSVRLSVAKSIRLYSQLKEAATSGELTPAYFQIFLRQNGFSPMKEFKV